MSVEDESYVFYMTVFNAAGKKNVFHLIALAVVELDPL